MTQKEKELLIKDLSERLPYSLYIRVEEFNVPKNDAITEGVVGNYLKDNCCNDYDADALLSDLADDCINVKPYLRPMSSMTEDEKGEVSILLNYEFYIDDDCALVAEDDRHRIRLGLMQVYIDWLNAHHFDYRGLIEKGLALEAPEGMYK